MARRTRRSLHRAMSFVAVIAVTAIPAVAQDPNVRLSEPQAWRDGQTLVVAAGQTVRIRGFAFHPGGVREVLINGAAATLVPDPPIVRFEHVMVADPQRRDVTVAVVPVSGQRYEVRYAISFPVTAPATPPVTPPVTLPVSPPVTLPEREREREPAITTGAPDARIGNPWGGFKVRAILYGAAAVGGAVLGMGTSSSSVEECRGPATSQDCFLVTTEKPSFAAGMPVAGVAIAAALLDFAMTSRRAKATARSTAVRAQWLSNVTAGPRFGSVRVHVLRVGF